MQLRKQVRPELAEARQKGFYNISDAAHLSGVSAKMIRHYEQIGLIPAAHRTYANYRIFSQSDVHTLIFIKRARTLGFSMKKIATLLSLYQDEKRSSAEVKRLVQEHIRELEDSMLQLQQMRDALGNLAHLCHGDNRPDCPILEGISSVH